ncbi:MAG TPA: alginate lyase family protein [Tepidisphaeraceae bacterium]|nr:alginate lyase family protein [Tepidisphaeraceae bacterium]
MTRATARLAIAIVSILLGVQTKVQAADTDRAAPNVLQWDGVVLAKLREQWRAHDPQVMPVLTALRDGADRALADGPYSVTFKKHPLPGVDPHDYVSLAPYAWPNPDTRDHLPYVTVDGKRNPEFAEFDALPFIQITDHLEILSLAGYITGDVKYFDRAALLIRTWCIDPTTRMNPNLDHAQVIKGQNNNVGNNTGVIESRRFISFIDATELMRGTASWSTDDDAQFRAFISDFRTWLLSSKLGTGEAAAKNNHGSWYDVQAASYCIFRGDPAKAKSIVEDAKTKRIAVQIQPHGMQPDEIRRTKSSWYCAFNLAALTQLATLGQRVDANLWTYQTDDGRSIRKAIDWLIPYYTGKKSWTVKDIEGFSGKELFIPLRQAATAYHDARYDGAADQLVGQDVEQDDEREHPLRPVGLKQLLFPARK